MIMNETLIDAPAGRQEVTVSREFDAPRELVYRCCVEPELIAQWWGPRYLTNEIERLEPRPGGLWRFVQHAPDGTTHAFRGVYHDATPPERLVMTFEYEGTPGHVVLNTITLEDVGGRTRMVGSSVFQTLADRDAMVAAGMGIGAREGNDRLEELLRRLR